MHACLPFMLTDAYFPNNFLHIWHENLFLSLSLQQVVELDFLYPSEGIHRRWDNGFRITSTAATFDQAALILSVPRRKPGDETQETLRTSQFPSTHVKVTSCSLIVFRTVDHVQSSILSEFFDLVYLCPMK